MSDLTTIDGWRIRRRDVIHGTVSSLLRRHVEHLRYWASKACTSPTTATALCDIANEIEMVCEWARENEPEEAPPKPLPRLWPRSPAESDG